MLRSTWASSDGLSRNCMFPVMCWAVAPVSDSSIRIAYELIFFDWSAAARIACTALWLAVCPPDPWSPEPWPLPDPELLLLCPPAGVKEGCGLLPPPHPASAASPRPAASSPAAGRSAGWRVRRRVTPYLAIIAILPKVGGSRVMLGPAPARRKTAGQARWAAGTVSSHGGERSASDGSAAGHW